MPAARAGMTGRYDVLKRFRFGPGADGVNGLLCEVRNAESLAARLAQMLDMSGAARRAMGERGRQKVAAEFDERVVVAKYKDLVRNLTGVSL